MTNYRVIKWISFVIILAGYVLFNILIHPSVFDSSFYKKTEFLPTTRQIGTNYSDVPQATNNELWKVQVLTENGENTQKKTAESSDLSSSTFESYSREKTDPSKQSEKTDESSLEKNPQPAKSTVCVQAASPNPVQDNYAPFPFNWQSCLGGNSKKDHEISSASAPIRSVSSESLPPLEVRDFPSIASEETPEQESVSFTSPIQKQLRSDPPVNSQPASQEIVKAPHPEEVSDLEKQIAQIESANTPSLEASSFSPAVGTGVSPQDLPETPLWSGAGIEKTETLAEVSQEDPADDSSEIDPSEIMDLGDLEAPSSLRDEVGTEKVMEAKETGNIPVSEPEEEFQTAAVYPHFGMKKPVEIQDVSLSVSTEIPPMGDGLEILPDEEAIVTKKVPVDFPPVEDEYGD